MLHRDTFGVVDLPDPIASAEFHAEPAQAAAVIKIDGGLLFWPWERGAELVPHLRRHWSQADGG